MNKDAARNLYQNRGDEIGRWLKREYNDELGRLCQRFPGEQSTLTIDWMDVYRFDGDLAKDVRDNTDTVRAALEWVVEDSTPPGGVDNADKLTVAFSNAGDPKDVTELITGDDVGRLVTLRGQATKATDTRPKLTTAGLRCQGCGVTQQFPQPTHGSHAPESCTSCDTRTPNWEPELSESESTQHQLVRIKHEPGEGDSDSWIDAHLTGDAAGSISGGESIDVTGVLEDVWPDGLDSGEPEFILDADSVRKHESDFESIDVATYRDRVKELAAGEDGDPYDILVESMAPGIFGGELMERVKLSLVLQLFGGRRIEKSDGTAFRGDIHQLLVGGPGTGKSTLQDAVKEYSPRVSTVSGKNASKAGITAAAVRDDFGDTEWSIEAGAIVQAHKGICIIDELDKVDGDALSSLHSALERQELSVAKAGINANLRCHTSLLGAANPTHERFIEEEATIEQIPVGSAMRSRLDAVFVLRDEVDEKDDGEKVEHMLRSLASGENVETRNFDTEDEIQAPLSKNEIQAWVAHARQEHEVDFDMDVLVDRVKDYYVNIRQESAGTGAPVTIRKPSAVVRYAVASARVRLGDVVTDEDIDRAISVVGASLAQIGMTEDGELSGDAGVAEKVTQGDRKARIKNALSGEHALSPAEISEETGIEQSVVNGELEQMSHDGEVLEPKTGEYRAV